MTAEEARAARILDLENQIRLLRMGLTVVRELTTDQWTLGVIEQVLAGKEMLKPACWRVRIRGELGKDEGWTLIHVDDVEPVYATAKVGPKGGA